MATPSLDQLAERLEQLERENGRLARETRRLRRCPRRAGRRSPRSLAAGAAGRRLEAGGEGRAAHRWSTSSGGPGPSSAVDSDGKVALRT